MLMRRPSLYYESNYGLVGSKSTFICGVETYVKTFEFLNLKISQFNQAESDYDMEVYSAHKCRLKRVLR